MPAVVGGAEWVKHGIVAGDGGGPAGAAELYLDLLKRSLTRTLHPDPYRRLNPMRGTWTRRVYVAHLPLRKALARGGLELVRVLDTDGRAVGRDIPAFAETMVGLERLN